MNKISQYTKRIVDNGYVRLNHQIPTKTITNALNYSLIQQQSLSSTWLYKFRRLFNGINSPTFRHSFPVDLSPEIHDVVTSVVSNHKEFFQELAGQDGILVELSVLLTFPGASEQTIHSDIPYGSLNDDPITGAPGLASVFVALQEITKDMGPTLILAKTHLPEFHKTIVPTTQETYNAEGELEIIHLDQGNEDDGDDDSVVHNTQGNVQFTLEEVQNSAILCNAGESYIMDSRCAHLGGANTSSKERAVLCFAFQRKHDEKASGFTYHINSDLEGKWQVKDFC